MVEQKLTETGMERYFRAVNYLAAAQIYLQDNVLLRTPLAASHIKPRLLGHWGTCPGINYIYLHLNELILKERIRTLLLTGPGHGAPAILANLYLEGTLEVYYPDLKRDVSGLRKFIRSFSWPGGFPSHLYPGIPGTIHEGGELGYALATAFGAALDDPDVLVACIVGDGEAETGPTAAAWHCPKFLDPAESGAVLPILHLNQYKISNPTILGTLSTEELEQLFRGYGWEPHFVSVPDDGAGMSLTLNQCWRKIRDIQTAARSGNCPAKPRWPMIVFRSPKGWTGIKELDGAPVEGSFRSHQVPLPKVKENAEHLRMLEDWLRSYRPEELFNDLGQPAEDILRCCPGEELRMGTSPTSFGGRIRRPLVLPELHCDAVPVEKGRGQVSESSVEKAGCYLTRVIASNPKSFRIFSPDELASNKLDGVFAAPTQRNYQWPVEGEGKAESIGGHGGRILEILSEHTCQAWLQGYLLTGRHGLFPSYEAFLNIVSSMMDQYAKFLKMSAELDWRCPVSSLTYLETSTLWRQEHNGFSHQNPGFINALLNKKKDVTRVYLPPDANCLLVTLDHCLRGTNHVNLVIANKQPMPVWLSLEEAIAHCRTGASIWDWASTDQGVDPDVVLVGIGDVVMHEVMAAADLLRQLTPEMRLRVINVTDLMILATRSEHPHGLTEEMFEMLFTADRRVIMNFHGYPSAVEQLMFGRPGMDRFTINGYREEGTTTTPFDMLVRNGTSRYDVALQAIMAASFRNSHVAAKALQISSRFEYLLRELFHTIQQTGDDPEEVSKWTWRSRPNP